MPDLCRFFPLSTTIIDTKKTSLMFCKTLHSLPVNSRDDAGTIPAHHFKLVTEKCQKAALKDPILTHDLTHQMTHGFGSPVSQEMSVITRVSANLLIDISVHFLPLFRAAKKLGQMPIRILAQTNDFSKFSRAIVSKSETIKKGCFSPFCRDSNITFCQNSPLRCSQNISSRRANAASFNYLDDLKEIISQDKR
jgi:hypothetical protein